MTQNNRADDVKVVECAACGDEHHSALMKISPYPHYSEPKTDIKPDIMGNDSASAGPLVPYGPDNPNPQGYDPSEDNFAPADGGGD